MVLSFVLHGMQISSYGLRRDQNEKIRAVFESGLVSRRYLANISPVFRRLRRTDTFGYRGISRFRSVFRRTSLTVEFDSLQRGVHGVKVLVDKQDNPGSFLEGVREGRHQKIWTLPTPDVGRG